MMRPATYQGGTSGCEQPAIVSIYGIHTVGCFTFFALFTVALTFTTGTLSGIGTKDAESAGCRIV